MTERVSAAYEHGVLRLRAPLALADGAEVEVIILTASAADPQQAPADILAAIAALPIEGDTRPFSGRDHDRILYGERGTR